MEQTIKKENEKIFETAAVEEAVKQALIAFQTVRKNLKVKILKEEKEAFLAWEVPPLPGSGQRVHNKSVNRGSWFEKFPHGNTKDARGMRKKSQTSIPCIFSNPTTKSFHVETFVTTSKIQILPPLTAHRQKGFT